MMATGNIHNYYEHLVIQLIMDKSGKTTIDDYVEDVACVALNKLPPRYIRHDIDMAFYLQDQERELMMNQIESAIKYAFEYVASHKESAA